jgi:hypothetical protein
LEKFDVAGETSILRVKFLPAVILLVRFLIQEKMNENKSGMAPKPESRNQSTACSEA